MPLHLSLLEKGYFPAEVQPPFQTVEYSKHVAAVGAAKLKVLAGKQWWTKKCRHNLARPGGLRRSLALLNPIGYLAVAIATQAAWASSLRPLLKKSTHSASRPILSKGPRSIAHVGADDIESRRAQARSGKRYVLHADIQNFYPSVYTHCIPWALYGKGVAKAGGKRTALGDELDRALRGSNEGQTVGIPIGPDASLIVAESVLANVESELIERVGKISGYRWIDDFELCCKSLGEAEDCLSVLQEILSEFELTLNPKKTRIIELPEPQEKPAIAELRRWEFSTSPRRQLTDLVAYFDRAFVGLAQDPGGSLASYAIGRLRSVRFASLAWPLLQNLCLQMIVAEPSCARLVIELFAVQKSIGHAVDAFKYSEATETIALKHAPMGHGSEVAWMLWGAIWNKIRISKVASAAISKMDDNVVALLALRANALKLCRPAIDTSKWEAVMTANELRGENWLVAYEASIQGWLPSSGTKDHVAGDPFFASLRTAGVTFFNSASSALPRPRTAVLGAGGPSRSIP